MLNNIVITIDKEDFILVNNGKFDVDRLLDLSYEDLEQVIDELDLLDVEGLDEIDIQDILFCLCRRILQQKQEIAELKARC